MKGVLPRQHPCIYSLCVGLCEKCWWIASTNTSCMSGKEVIADGKNFSGRFHLNTSSDHKAGTMLVAPCWLEYSHPHYGIPTKGSLSTLPLIPSPCQRSPALLRVVLHTSSPVLRAFLPGYLTTQERMSPIRGRYVFYRKQLGFKKE